MGQTEPTRQSDEILPPIEGSIVVLTAGTSIVTVDLTTWPQTPALPNTTVKGSEHANPLGQYVTLVADGGTVYVAFAATVAALASCTAAATTSVAANVMTVSGNEMIPVVAGVPYNFRLPPGPSAQSSSPGSTVKWGTLSNARFMGFLVKSGVTANLVGWVSSR